MKFTLLACLISSAVAQYGDEQLLPYSPPSHSPPVEQTELHGFDVKLRAPPVPTWIERLNQESNSNELSNDISQSSFDYGSGIETENNSGDHSGENEEGSGDLETEGSGSGISPNTIEGEGFEDFNTLMHNMDKASFKNGVHCPSDVIFVLDATSSVKGVFDQYIAYIQKALQGMDIRKEVDRVGVIVYSSERKQKISIPLGKYSKLVDLQSAINKLPFFSGITATGQALKFAANHTEGRRDNVTLHYVVLTDGYSYDLIEGGARALSLVPNSKIYTVALGDIYLEKELQLIARSEERVFLGADSFAPMVKKIKMCAARIENSFDANAESATVRDIPTPTDASGRHLIPIAKHTRDGIIHFNDKATKEQIEEAINNSNGDPNLIAPTTFTPIFTKECKYDIGIIFDSSGSLNKGFQTQLEFADKLLKQLPISNNMTRVSLLQFAGKTKTKVLASFAERKTKTQLRRIVNDAHFYSGTTYTNRALVKMAELFNESPRSDSKKYVIIFTDGYSAEDTAEGAEALKTLGATIYTVGVTINGVALNLNELETMATSPEHYYQATDFELLLVHMPSVVFCSGKKNL